MSVDVVAFSGGVQSSVLAWMAIRGDITVPRYSKESKLFALVTADTGDERKRTYENLDTLARAAKEAGITHLVAPGPKIPADYSEAFEGHRIDTIPYWTKNPDGSIGQLNHGCTRHYKVRPQRRIIAKWLSEELCISIGAAQRVKVDSWIGFAADEEHRAKKVKGDTATWRTKFPLIELGMTKQDCVDYLEKNNLPMPIPSVCAGCFANGLRTFKWMYENDKDAWDRAVKRDEYIRHGLERFGVKNPCYISSTCVPLRELAEMDFRLPKITEHIKHECSQGVCFV